MPMARWYEASDSAILPWRSSAIDSEVSTAAVSGCCSPNTFSMVASAARCICSAWAKSPRTASMPPRLLSVRAVDGCSRPSVRSWIESARRYMLSISVVAPSVLPARAPARASAPPICWSLPSSCSTLARLLRLVAADLFHENRHRPVLERLGAGGVALLLGDEGEAVQGPGGVLVIRPEAPLVARQHAAEVALGLAEPSHPVVRRAEQVERDGDVRVIRAEATDVLLEQTQARGLRAREVAALQRLLRLVEELARAGVVDLARWRGLLLRRRGLR